MTIRRPGQSRIGTQNVAAFSPLTVANCELWLDASDASSVTLTSSAVSQWNDLSGNNRHATQSTANNRPTYADKVNGRNVITFDGTNDVLTTGLASSVFAGYITMLVVGRPSSTYTTGSAGTGIYKTPAFARNADSTLGWGVTFYDDGFFRLTHNWRGSGFNFGNGPIVTLGVAQIMGMRLSAPQADRRVTGASQVAQATLTAGTGGSSTAYLSVGADLLQSRYWKDYICEVLVYSRTLSDAEMTGIEAYLIAKWGISRQ